VKGEQIADFIDCCATNASSELVAHAFLPVRAQAQTGMSGATDALLAQQSTDCRFESSRLQICNLKSAI
jgi:hypothetical protein